MLTPPLTFPDRIKSIKERVKKAVEKSGRTAESVVLVAVGKTVPVEVLSGLVGWGITDIGENKVQEAETKRPYLPTGVYTNHFIGQLQTNKARKAVQLFDVIQTVDRPRLAETLDRIAGELGKHQRCLIEVKISEEPTKGGIPINEADDFIRGFARYQNLVLEGLMTIAPNELNESQTRACFRSFMRFGEQQKSFLGEYPRYSFGMSDDFEIAIEEGSNMVRIGRALFGERSA